MEKILKRIKDTDEALADIQRKIVSYKNIVDKRTAEFLEQIKDEIQKLRLNKLQ